ncbi:phage tail protein I [Oricola indica]|jgi:hypothetical protein|uniref:phage tail protein I n=1 Tax=Oricola indica TaxID=2872591 RepID=UPI001CBE79F9|nr:phage tail protein I [Oricola indica]
MTAEFASILPSSASPMMLGIEETSGERWDDADVDIVRRARDPWTCPAHLLNFLAYERSVDIWDRNWPDWKKRSVIASAPADHRIKGTLAGIRRYLDIADAELKQHVVPPQGFYASPDLTKEEWDAHIGKHPKIRITLAHGYGTYERPDGFFADLSFTDDAFNTFEEGRALHGRRAYIVQDGVQHPLQLSEVETDTESRDGTVRERIVVPGVAANALYADASFVDDAFADATDRAPQFYTFALSRQYLHSESRLALTTVPVGFQPRDTRFYRESENGTKDYAFFEGDFAGTAFASLDRADELLADVLYLLDPEVAVPQVAGMSFADVSRVGMDHHTAELLVDWKASVKRYEAFFAGVSFTENGFARDASRERRDFLLSAVHMSKRLSDKVRVTFQTRRERTLGDGIPLDGSVRLGDTVPHIL